MKKKVLVIAKTLMNGGFGTQLFDEDPTCDCCFSKLNLDKSKVKKLIKFLVTEDEECKDVVITDVVISNSFIGSELNFGENNVYVFKEKHLIRTEPESDILNVVSSAKDEESTKQMCKILGVDYEEYKKFSKMMNKALEPMSKENLEKTLNNLSEDKSDLLIPENEMSYKFKDPRDALHFLVRNWEIMEVTEVETLFEYVQFGANLNIYTVMDIYYLTMLEVIITFLVKHPKPIYNPTEDIASNGINDTTLAINGYNKHGFNMYVNKLKRVIRESHLYAVANTWINFNIHYRYHNKIYKECDITDFKEMVYLEFNHNEVIITEFNGFGSIFKIQFLKDKKFILAKVFDNKFYGISKFNSYVIE